MKDPSYLVVCMNPTFQKTLCFSAIVPNTVNRTEEHRLDIAGKGFNVCRILTQLGKRALHLTQLGGDLRPFFLKTCAADGVPVHWVESYSPIRFCYTLIEKNGAVTELVEEGSPVEAGTEGRVREAYQSLLPDYSRVIIAGTKAAGFSGDLIPWMVRLARERDRKILLDVRGSDLTQSLPFYPDLIKPNLFEFASTFAPELIVNNDLIIDEKRVKDRIQELCRELCRKYRITVVLTRGGSPIWAAREDRFFEIPVEKTQPVNTIGSGDAFTAGLAAALDEGAALDEAASRGAHYGALNAALLKPGTIA
jgi:1-phosphofructokinase/tagatose 6-phosphate kinase